MITIQNYRKVEDLAEAYELNQKKANRIVGGMMWLRMSKGRVQTAIDLSGLGLDTIEEDVQEFRIGGGSIFGRFGFSDVLTCFLAMDSYVELYQGGIVPLREFVQMERDRDILVRLIVKKDGRKAVCLSERACSTDFPILVCTVSISEGRVEAAIGARPMKADMIEKKWSVAKDASLEKIEEYAALAAAEFKYGTNMRGSAGYRQHLAKVLIKREIMSILSEEI